MQEIDYMARNKEENSKEGRIKVLSVFGTRPEAIKMAPLVQELKNNPEQFESTVVVTAQHREMLDQVLRVFHIQPDYDLDIMKPNQSLARITTAVMNGIETVLEEVKPDIVLVHGDTSTTFSAALAAYYQQIPIGHVEAGLRTWNKYSPFPEEMNRQLTGVISDLHFAPTERAKSNLLTEKKQESTIFVTGNTAIDALKTTVSNTYSHPILDDVGNKRLVLLTAHRRENVGKNLKQIFRAMKRLVEKHEDIHVVYPMHLNPRIQQMASEVLGDTDRIDLISPLQVTDFHNFAAHATLILTDSGGIQEEAPSLGVPVLVLRDTTERPEGIDAGTLKLVGTEEDDVFRMADELLTNKLVYEQMAQAKNPYGDGEASKRIVNIIWRYFNENKI